MKANACMDKLLREAIAVELENIHRLKVEMDLVTGKKQRSEPEFSRSVGSILHDFYCGIEKILKRIAVAVDGNLPADAQWHKSLLMQMAENVPGKRDAVLSGDLAAGLKNYLTFRHLFRNIYGFNLKWEQEEELCKNLPEICSQLEAEVHAFIEKI